VGDPDTRRWMEEARHGGQADERKGKAAGAVT
jgi:hypothetical protein